MVPDGFIACLFGPVPAKTHDAKLLRESELLDQLKEVMPPDDDAIIYMLYGDLVYAQSMYLIVDLVDFEMLPLEWMKHCTTTSCPLCKLQWNGDSV